VKVHKVKAKEVKVHDEQKLKNAASTNIYVWDHNANTRIHE
jgi:hypothetical protein